MSTHIWQFKGDDGSFYNFDQKACLILEESYAKFLNGDVDVRSVKSGEGHYMVDFRLFTQTNILSENHTIRTVRRHKICKN